MRALILNQVFWPDRAGSARLATDLARFLGECGVEVAVVTGPPLNPVETKEPPPVRIIRAPCLFPGTGFTARTLSIAGYFTVTLMYTLFGPKPDVIVTLTTPPLLSVVGLIAWGASSATGEDRGSTAPPQVASETLTDATSPASEGP